MPLLISLCGFTLIVAALVAYVAISVGGAGDPIHSDFDHGGDR